MPSLKRQRQTGPCLRNPVLKNNSRALARTTPTIAYTPPSDTRAQNSITSTIRLLDVNRHTKKFVSDAKVIVNEITKTPRGVGTKIKCNELTAILDTFDTSVVIVLENDIIPNLSAANRLGRMKYVHSRLLNEGASLPPQYASALITPPKPRRKLQYRRLLPTRERVSSGRSNIPTPSNSTQFKPVEAFEVYEKMGSKSIVLKEWYKRKYIPSMTTFFRLLKVYRQCGFVCNNNRKTKSGRHPIVYLVDAVAKINSGSTGHATSAEDTRSLLESELLETSQLQNNGCLLGLAPPTVHESTVRNYMTLLGSSSQSKILRSIQQKTDNRHSAESSIIYYLFHSNCFIHSSIHW